MSLLIIFFKKSRLNLF